MDQIYIACFKILSPWENYGLQHWCREWIEQDALKCSQVSIPCQTTFPSPHAWDNLLYLLPCRQSCCQIWLANSALDQFPTSSKERLLSETRRLNIMKKFQEIKLEFGLFESQVLSTEIVGALNPRPEFYMSKSQLEDVCVHDAHHLPTKHGTEYWSLLTSLHLRQWRQILRCPSVWPHKIVLPFERRINSMCKPSLNK